MEIRLCFGMPCQQRWEKSVFFFLCLRLETNTTSLIHAIKRAIFAMSPNANIPSWFYTRDTSQRLYDANKYVNWSLAAVAIASAHKHCTKVIRTHMKRTYQTNVMNKFYDGCKWYGGERKKFIQSPGFGWLCENLTSVADAPRVRCVEFYFQILRLFCEKMASPPPHTSPVSQWLQNLFWWHAEQLK